MPDYTIPENCDFDSVNDDDDACFPKIIKPTFECVLINVPKKILLSDNMKVPLACSFNFSVRRDLAIFEGINNAIVFTVVDKDTHIPYSGKVPDIPNRIPQPGGPRRSVKGKDLPDEYWESNVNPDLVKIARIPKKLGKYIVYATVSTFKSNVMEFEIISDPANYNRDNTQDTNDSSENYGIEFKTKMDDNGKIIISGLFRVKEGNEYKRGDNIHAAVVLVATTPGSFLSLNPFKDIIMFEDDLVFQNGVIIGKFDIDFSSIIKPMDDKRFNILLSIGKHLSDIETIMLK